MLIDAPARRPTLLATRAPMTHFFKLALSGLVLVLGGLAAESAAPRPWETGALNVETGLLWNIGTGTPLSYRLVPTQLSWRSKEFLGHAFADGSRIMIRHRLTLIGTWIQQGPESHYVGFSGSPSVEWWDRTGTWSLFTGAGGGFGLLDSRGVRGGQGQDFTLNWFIRGGVEIVAAKDRRFSAGIMYQHMSNGGQTTPNPGIDALGFTLGYSWRF
jgi:lipid A 3-O-deacylase